MSLSIREEMSWQEQMWLESFAFPSLTDRSRTEQALHDANQFSEELRVSNQKRASRGQIEVSKAGSRDCRHGMAFVIGVSGSVET